MLNNIRVELIDGSGFAIIPSSSLINCDILDPKEYPEYFI
jgi:hypothetical protein